MTKITALLDLANRMIHAGMDQKIVSDVLIQELKKEINNLEKESENILPFIEVENILEK